MFSSKVLEFSNACQYRIYFELNDLSGSHPNCGRLCAIPVSVLDIAIDTLSVPLIAFENVALVAINLFNAAFSYQSQTSQSLKDSLSCTEFALRNAVCTPVAIFMALPKLVFQLSASLIDPRRVQSIHFTKPTYIFNFQDEFYRFNSNNRFSSSSSQYN